VRRFFGAGFAALLLVSSVGSAALASGGPGTNPVNFSSGGPDNGTCGTWADDTYNLHFTVQNNGDGTWLVRTDYNGAKFVTRAGFSPGGCQGPTPHGTFVLGGIKGNFDAWVEETITAASYNSNACGKPNSGTCTSRSQFILAAFGCDENNPTCNDWDAWAWDFQYRSSDKRLIYNFWRDAWPALTDEFSGDIATS
jgi:hypothetical protein